MDPFANLSPNPLAIVMSTLTNAEQKPIFWSFVLRFSCLGFVPRLSGLFCPQFFDSFGTAMGNGQCCGGQIRKRQSALLSSNPSYRSFASLVWFLALAHAQFTPQSGPIEMSLKHRMRLFYLEAERENLNLFIPLFSDGPHLYSLQQQFSCSTS